MRLAQRYKFKRRNVQHNQDRPHHHMHAQHLLLHTAHRRERRCGREPGALYAGEAGCRMWHQKAVEVEVGGRGDVGDVLRVHEIFVHIIQIFWISNHV